MTDPETITVRAGVVANTVRQSVSCAGRELFPPRQLLNLSSRRARQVRPHAEKTFRSGLLRFR